MQPGNRPIYSNRSCLVFLFLLSLGFSCGFVVVFPKGFLVELPCGFSANFFLSHCWQNKPSCVVLDFLGQSASCRVFGSFWSSFFWILWFSGGFLVTDDTPSGNTKAASVKNARNLTKTNVNMASLHSLMKQFQELHFGLNICAKWNLLSAMRLILISLKLFVCWVNFSLFANLGLTTGQLKTNLTLSFKSDQIKSTPGLNCHDSFNYSFSILFSKFIFIFQSFFLS